MTSGAMYARLDTVESSRICLNSNPFGPSCAVNCGCKCPVSWFIFDGSYGCRLVKSVGGLKLEEKVVEYVSLL